jgi:Lysyl oxidase
VLVVALAVLASGGGAGAGDVAPRELLPDLVARAPWKVAVKTVGREHRLVFSSAGANVGAGPLEILAERPDRTSPTMRADQLVRQSNGATRRYEGVGDVRYVVSADHQHWHFLRFMRYELRRASGGGPIVRDRKTGFCLGDRYNTGRRLPRKPRQAVFRGGCGFRETELLRVREGISVGYGDNYRAELEGQYLDLTGLPAGRYRLVHTVDEDGLLRERTRSNNVAWLLLRLSWRDGRPQIRVGEGCGQSTRCTLPSAPRRH